VIDGDSESRTIFSNNPRSAQEGSFLCPFDVELDQVRSEAWEDVIEGDTRRRRRYFYRKTTRFSVA